MDLEQIYASRGERYLDGDPEPVFDGPEPEELVYEAAPRDQDLADREEEWDAITRDFIELNGVLHKDSWFWEE
jgi:hypothetical protein